MNLRAQFANDLKAILTEDEMAVTITYTPKGGAAKPIVAHWMKDANGVDMDVGIGARHTHGIARILIQKADIDLPKTGDLVTYLGEDYKVKDTEQTLEHAHVCNLQNTADELKLPNRRGL